MLLSGLISNIHWVPVVIMVIVSFALGALWHQPFLFGKIWEKENNPNKVERKLNVPLIFGVTAIVHFIAIAGLGAIVSGLGAIQGMLGGLFICIVWVFPTMCGTYLFAGRSFKLLAIDAGMYIVLFSLSGLVLGAW